MNAIYSILLCLGGESQSPIKNWKYRKSIIIDHTKVMDTLYNFPVLVSTNSDADLVSHAKATGEDILFVGDDGETIFPYEIEYYNNSTGRLIAWVKLPLISSTSDTTFYIYYGNSLALSHEDVDKTWEDEYIMIQHQGENPSDSAPQFIDKAPTPNIASSFTLNTRYNVSSSSNDAQGITTDNNYVYWTNSSELRKYDKNGNLVLSRNVMSDNPLDKSQINGVFHKDGIIYASCAKQSTTTRIPYVVEYSASDLSFITYHTLTENAFSEGLVFYNGYWFIIFHGNRMISQYSSDWNHINTFNLKFPITGGVIPDYGPEGGYDGIFNIGNYFYLNIHEIFDQNYYDIYYWNGSSFDAVYRNTRVTSYATQGCCVDQADPTVFWWAERNTVDAFIKTTSNNSFVKNNGSSNGSLSQNTGKIENGITYNGSTGYISYGNGDIFNIKGHQTWQAWVKPNGTSNYGGIITKANGTSNYGFALRWGFGSDGKFGGWLGDGTNAYYAMGTTSATSGVWYHVAMVYDMTEVKVFVNGIFEDGISDAYSGAVAPSTNSVFSGRYQSSLNYFFNGMLDEIRVSHTAKTSNWLLTEYNNQNSPETFYSIGSEEILN